VDGTSDGFDHWFRGLHPAVHATVERLLGSRAAADDIVAEAFVRALVRWSRISRLDHRDAWLFRVATNLAIDVLRRRPPRPDTTAAGTGAAPDGAAAVELRLLLTPALRRLSRRQRETVVLRYLGQMSEREVADALDLPVGTVKTHLRRGLNALRSDRHLRDEEMIHALPAR
jgi:RNA polymerase sigma-70 factor (sigma-E family)